MYCKEVINVSGINRFFLLKPFALQWSIKRRFELAGLLSSILRAHLEAYDPILSLMLRYLIRYLIQYIRSVFPIIFGQIIIYAILTILQHLNSIHKAFCKRQGISSPISDLTERLLFEDRDPPVVPQECLLEAPPFDEASTP